MKTPTEIIELIREDAPCVFDILNEEHRPWMYGYFPQSNSTWTWEDFYKKNPDIVPPTPDELLEILSEYSGDNYDTHYWSGRYTQMKLDAEDTIRVPLSEYDLDQLREGETFEWEFGGRKLFLFHSDLHSEYDEDSDDYDPSLTIYDLLNIPF